VLGLQDEIGALAAGTRADVLLVDRDLRPVTVLRGGREV
jgi:N-acetylglucosamine-6-phosphate deacetylase